MKQIDTQKRGNKEKHQSFDDRRVTVQLKTDGFDFYYNGPKDLFEENFLPLIKDKLTATNDGTEKQQTTNHKIPVIDLPTNTAIDNIYLKIGGSKYCDRVRAATISAYLISNNPVITIDDIKARARTSSQFNEKSDKWKACWNNQSNHETALKRANWMTRIENEKNNDKTITYRLTNEAIDFINSQFRG